MSNVPKLRFKGFSGEWEKNKLGDFLDFYTTNSLSRDCLNYEAGDIKNIHYGDIHMKFSTIVDAQKEIIPFINSDIDTTKIKEESFCRSGDLIIADASEDYNDIGKAIEIENIGESKIVAGLHTILARDNKNLTSRRFKGYMMLNDSTRKQIKILAAGAKVLGISKVNLAKVVVKLPSLEEQEKIANFLTKVDKIIEKQAQKVSKLEKYKKGMIQKIFSQEIRFKRDDGREYSEWENKKLEEISIKITEKNKDFRIKNIISNSAKAGLISQRDFFDKDIANKANIDGYYIIKPGDFVYNPRKSYEAPYGPINIYKLSKEGVVSPLYFCFRINKNINKTYMEYYFKSTNWYRYIHMNSDQGVRHDRVSIKDSEIMGMTINLPSSLEQNKIANFFINIDSIVEREKQKLEELINWKKGLLQRMLV
jgi:type I restriction enzyme, S subunit